MADTPWGKAAEEAWIRADYTRKQAEMVEDYDLRCGEGEKVFHVPDSQARMPGHIYSTSGKDEYGISHCCEWHYDKWFPPECNLVKLFPGDSPGLWDHISKIEYYLELRERGLDEPVNISEPQQEFDFEHDHGNFDDYEPVSRDREEWDEL